MTQFRFHRAGRPVPSANFPFGSGPWSTFFDDFAQSPGSSRTRGISPTRGVYPPVNLVETVDAFVLTAEIPGVAADDIDVSLEGQTVTLSGQRKVDSTAGDGVAVHRRERAAGHFKRAFELPKKFDLEAAEAKHKNGVLELRLPKSPEAQARQISVQSR